MSAAKHCSRSASLVTTSDESMMFFAFRSPRLVMTTHGNMIGRKQLTVHQGYLPDLEHCFPRQALRMLQQATAYRACWSNEPSIVRVRPYRYASLLCIHLFRCQRNAHEIQFLGRDDRSAVRRTLLISQSS